MWVRGALHYEKGLMGACWFKGIPMQVSCPSREQLVQTGHICMAQPGSQMTYSLTSG